MSIDVFDGVQYENIDNYVIDCCYFYYYYLIFAAKSYSDVKLQNV